MNPVEDAYGTLAEGWYVMNVARQATSPESAPWGHLKDANPWEKSPEGETAVMPARQSKKWIVALSIPIKK